MCPSPGSAAVLCAFAGLAAAACGGVTEGSRDTDADAGVDTGTDTDTGSETSEAVDDGTPTYTSDCTPLEDETGTAIDTQHGRLDGTLAFVVPIDGDPTCNGDSSHLHLQVRVLGDIYDVAVNTGDFTGDVNLYEADMPMPDGPWSEGWHGADDLTYTSLGVHSDLFTPQAPSELGAKIAAELDGKNHVSIFGTGYSPGNNGCHDIHYYSGNGQDGAIVIDPLSTPAHVLFFRFSDDGF